MATDISLIIRGENRANEAISAVEKRIDLLQNRIKVTDMRIMKQGATDADIRQIQRTETEIRNLQNIVQRSKPKLDVNTQDARARIKDLEYAIDTLKARAATGQISVGDLSKLREAQTELKGLQSALNGITGTTTGGGGRLGGFNQLLGGLGLGGLTQFAGLAGLGAAAVTIGKTAVELGQLGEQVQKQRAYFEVWSGGVANATQNLEAMRRAVGNTMTDSEAMTGANKLLSMGLAKNADDLEKLSRMAVMLGGSTRTASESIEEFSLLLANQSILRLDTFGISGARVRERIQELQDATAGLSREQAFMQSVMEEGTRKVDALGAAGVKATTSTADLNAAWRQLKETIGEGIAPTVTKVETGLANDINSITRAIASNSNDPETKLAALVSRAKHVEAELEKIRSGDWIPSNKFENAATSTLVLEQSLKDLNTQIAYLKNGAAESGDAGVANAVRAAEAAKTAAGGVDKVDAALNHLNTDLEASQTWWGEWAGFAESAALVAQQAIANVQIGADAAAARWAGMGAGYLSRGDVGMEQYRYDASGHDARVVTPDADTLRWQAIGDKQNEIERANAKERDVLYKRSADKAASAYESAMRQAQSRIEGYLSKGINASISLKDVRGDIFKPGANGPFENLFRALDVAVNGTEKSPWDEVLGLDQETAKKISEDFQRGIFSPEVMDLVDVDALVNEAKMAELAEKTQAAFAQSIAQKAGVKVNLVSNLFGYGATGEGAKAGAAADKQVSDAMQQVASTIGDTVRGKDFAGRMIGYGSQIWGSIGQGFVEEAKRSSALQEAIDAMVAAALARRGATSGTSGGSSTSGVKGTARGQGVPVV